MPDAQTTPDLPTEAEIESHLLESAARVDKAVAATWGCGVSLGGAILGTLQLGPSLTYIGAGIVSFVGGLLVFGLISNAWDEWHLNRAVRDFETRYPRGSERRPLAERVLRELQSSGKGLPKFRERVLNPPVRRVPLQPTVDAQIAAAVRPPAPPPPVAPPAAPAEPGPMPLEPFDVVDREPKN